MLFVLFILHINKVNNNNPSQISEPYLIGNLFDSFKVGFQDCILQVSLTHILTGIDINGCKGFGLINDNVSSGF